MSERTGRPGRRPGDQRCCVSGTARFRAPAGWASRVSVRKGLENLYDWLLCSERAARAEDVSRLPAGAPAAGGTGVAARP